MKTTSPAYRRSWRDLLLPDPSRKILLPFNRPLSDQSVVQHIFNLPPGEVESLLKGLLPRFDQSHSELKALLLAAGRRAVRRSGVITLTAAALSDTRLLLIGAYSSKEYTLEAAALTNPSVVLHPNQAELEPGQVRALLSLRAIGEGHLSSIVFAELILSDSADPLLPHRSTKQIQATHTTPIKGNYHLSFPPKSELSSRTLYPLTPDEARGMEDARFVQMLTEDGTSEYRATFTAYSGSKIKSKLLVTKDFINFTVTTLTGPAAANKGMALFPSPVNGRYLALTRSDGHSQSISESPDGVNWEISKQLSPAKQPWDLLITGNCGSPLLTSAGWLVITHGVGPMRTYSLGAMLLDKDDPSKLLGRLKHPLLSPDLEGVSGYVPNVLYSCGSLIINQTLWLPYGVADRSLSLAAFHLPQLIQKILADGA